MEMDMNLGGIMVKISRMDFFMVADNVHSYSAKICKKTKVEKLTKN